jgi:chromosome segregation ATPase
VEQVTKEGKEKEEQLCRTRKELNAARETVEMFRFALEHRVKESIRDQKKLLEVSRERDKAQQSQKRITEAYGQLRKQLVESNQRVQSLIGHNEHLAGLAAAAHDELVAKVLFQLASRDSPQSQKSLPAIGDKAESSPLKGELAQAKEQIKLLTAKVEARKALPASSAETSLANRNIERLTSENRRLSEELKNAKELARQWNENFRLLAQRIADVEVESDEQRPIVRHSTLPEEAESEKPGFFSRALTALGLLGTGAVLGMGAAAALGREDSPQTLVAAPEHRVLAPTATQSALGSAPAQKALGPATRLLLPPKSES